MKELDELGDLRAEKLGRLRIVEREKNALEEKKKEADDFLKMQNELVRAQSRLYQWYLWRCFDLEAEYTETIVRRFRSRMYFICSHDDRVTSNRSLLKRQKKIKTISPIASCLRSILRNEAKSTR